MFGRRNGEQKVARPVAAPVVEAPQPETAPAAAPQPAQPAPVVEAPIQNDPSPRAGEGPSKPRSEEYYDVKTTVFNALIDTIDLTQLAKLDSDAAREEIRDIVSEIIQIKNVVMSIAEQGNFISFKH